MSVRDKADRAMGPAVQLSLFDVGHTPCEQSPHQVRNSDLWSEFGPFWKVVRKWSEFGLFLENGPKML